MLVLNLAMVLVTVAITSTGSTPVKTSMDHIASKRSDKTAASLRKSIVLSNQMIPRPTDTAGPSSKDSKGKQKLGYRVHKHASQFRALDITNSPKEPTITSSIKWDKRIRKLGDRGVEQYKRRKTFERLWNEHNLSLNMDPIELADKVFSMIKLNKEVQSRSSLSLASQFVKLKKESIYENTYMARMTQLSIYLSTELKRISNNQNLSKLNEEQQMELALEETFKGANRNEKKKRSRSNSSTGPIAYKKDAAERIEKVGKLAKNLVESKGFDFYSMSLSQLMNETRKLKIPGMDPKHFTRSLYRYIEYYRRDSKVEITAIKRARKSH